MNYILVDGEPVIEPDIHTWAIWFGNHDNRRVAFTKVGNVNISTVFLSIDHAFGGGPPVLFETMIFGGVHDGYQERYHTLEESMLGHERAVALVRSEENPTA